MRVISIVFVIGFFYSCYSPERKITFINHSELTIDSVLIGVSSADTYVINYSKLKPNDTLFTVIPNDKPKSNSHDITVDITIFIRGHEPIYNYSYNDLAGYLTHDYTIILNNKREVKWGINAN